jgi:uncharacterized protein involved in tolerance to divalent cations
MANEQLSIILITAPSPEVANQLAHGTVTERLAASVVDNGVMAIQRFKRSEFQSSSDRSAS